MTEQKQNNLKHGLGILIFFVGILIAWGAYQGILKPWYEKYTDAKNEMVMLENQIRSYKEKLLASQDGNTGRVLGETTIDGDLMYFFPEEVNEDGFLAWLYEITDKNSHFAIELLSFDIGELLPTEYPGISEKQVVIKVKMEKDAFVPFLESIEKDENFHSLSTISLEEVIDTRNIQLQGGGYDVVEIARYEAVLSFKSFYDIYVDPVSDEDKMKILE